MNRVATFSRNDTSVNVSNRGIVNGYKLLSILHKGDNVDLSDKNYYYIPFSRELVTYRGSYATVLKRNKSGTFNLRGTLGSQILDLKPDASMILQEAYRQFFG